MPLPIADPTLPPIIFLDTLLVHQCRRLPFDAVIAAQYDYCPPRSINFSTDANVAQFLMALHIQHYPYYAITSAAEDVTKEDLCIALRTAKLDFVADNLHETWQTPYRSNIKYLEQIEEWHATALYKRDPTSFLIIGYRGTADSLQGTHLADYTVQCNSSGRFDSVMLARAEMILRSQVQLPKRTLFSQI